MPRKPIDPNITTEYLHECFLYNEETGNLIWKERPLYHFKSEKKQKEFNSKRANKVADFNSQKGYLKVSLNNKQIMSHRVIWKMKTNQWPSQYIDHIDGNGQNNKWINLREASHHDNMKNRKNHKNKGHKGVKKNKTGYTAHITINKNYTRIGFYKTELEARQAYYTKAKEIFGEFTRIENEHELLPIPNDILERDTRVPKKNRNKENTNKIEEILKKYNTDMKYIDYPHDRKIWRFRIRNPNHIKYSMDFETIIKYKIQYLS